MTSKYIPPPSAIRYMRSLGFAFLIANSLSLLMPAIFAPGIYAPNLCPQNIMASIGSPWTSIDQKA